MSVKHEADADAIFRQDAYDLGYDPSCPHAPGEGRGLWAYYHEHGMLAPDEQTNEIPRWERPLPDVELTAEGRHHELLWRPTA